MKKIILLNLVSVLFIFSSCSKEVLRGGGSSSTRTLSLPAFSAVESHYDINAVISYGAIQQLTVTGYDNLLNILDFKVENGVLKMKYNSNYNTIRDGNVVARISIPVITRCTIHGSKNIDISGFNNGNSLQATIHGSGSINVSNSNYQSALLEVYGSGNIEAQGLQAKQAVAKIHGSGNASLTVSERIEANIFGSGNIYYWGNPVIETTQNGSGRVIKR